MRVFVFKNIFHPVLTYHGPTFATAYAVSPNLYPRPPASDTKGQQASAVADNLLVGIFSVTSQEVKLLKQLSFFQGRCSLMIIDDDF